MSSLGTQGKCGSMAESLTVTSTLSSHELTQEVTTAPDTSFGHESPPIDTPLFNRDDAPRRGRKSYSRAQLTMLEGLFQQTSHPTSEQRESLGRQANMYVHIVRFRCMLPRSCGPETVAYGSKFTANSAPSPSGSRINVRPSGKSRFSLPRVSRATRRSRRIDILQ